MDRDGLKLNRWAREGPLMEEEVWSESAVELQWNEGIEKQEGRWVGTCWIDPYSWFSCQ